MKERKHVGKRENKSEREETGVKERTQGWKSGNKCEREKKGDKEETRVIKGKQE